PFHLGADTLPPAVPGTLNNKINVAIGGPIYSYDVNNKYSNKFPPHFDNKWIIAGFGRSGAPWGIWAVTVDDTKDPFQSINATDLKAGIFANVPIRNFIGAKYGKDGALYITNYDGDYGTATNPGVVRVTYTGSCVTSIGSQKPAAPYQKIWIEPAGITVGESGPSTVSLFDMSGKRVWIRQGLGP